MSENAKQHQEKEKAVMGYIVWKTCNAIVIR